MSFAGVKISVGPTTAASYVAAVIFAIPSVVALIEGNLGSNGTAHWGAIISGLIIIVQQIGRYAQAVKAIPPGATVTKTVVTAPVRAPEAVAKEAVSAAAKTV